MNVRPSASQLSTVTLVLVVILAGCGGSPVDPAGPNTTPASTTSPTGEATTATTGVGTLEVHFINVGQSVATLLVSSTGETMLVDSGDYRTDGEHVIAYLNAHNITRLDHLVTSHADADHIGGHATVIKYFETQGDGVGAIYDSGITASTQTYTDYLDAVERYDVTLYEVRAGDEIPFEGVAVDILAPPEGYLDDRDRNENSVVLKVGHGDVGFLLTGDAGPVEESYLTESQQSKLSATVLKAGHHGSRSSTDEPLLDAVAPKVVVISSAFDSPYGHPHEETLQRLGTRNVDTYWTAVHGTVLLGSDGTTLTVHTQRAATTDPKALREYPAVEPGTPGSLEPRRMYPVDGDGETVRTTVSAATTQVTSDGLAVARIHADAARRDGDNLDDEYVVFTNTGSTALDLGGWVVSDAAGHQYTIPSGVTLAPAETLTVHTGSGVNNATDIYWGANSPVWNNDGDTITVTTDSGAVALQEAY